MITDRELDERLAAAGRNWRAARPDPQPVHVVLASMSGHARRGSAGRRWGVPLVATAVSVAMVVLAVVMVQQFRKPVHRNVAATAPVPDLRLGAQPLPTSPDTFVASVDDGTVAYFDSVTGARLVDVLKQDPTNPRVRVAGYARDSHGDLWYAVNREPFLRAPGLMNGAPQPDTCGGAIFRIDHATGGTEFVLAVGADRTIADPVPSPDRTRLAYRTAPCTDWVPSTVVTRNLTSGTETELLIPGAEARVPSWKPDGSELVVAVAWSNPKTRDEVNGYVIVPPDQSGSVPTTALRLAPDPHCSVAQAAFDTTGVLLLQGCPDTTSEPADLVQLDPTGTHLLWSKSTGLCPNGASISVRPSDDKLLIVATDHCGGEKPMLDVVQQWVGNEAVASRQAPDQGLWMYHGVW